MLQTALVSFITASVLTMSSVSPEVSGSAQTVNQIQARTELGSASMSLDNRLQAKSLNDIYKDNMLLNLAYFSGEVKSKEDIDWDEIRKPFILQFSLEPGQRFAYHEWILDEYKDGVVLTTNTHFSAKEGYKTDGNLYGMGVCHLASLIHRSALNAGLESIAPTNHDFYPINEIPKEYGVAIYPDTKQNLYIRNNFDSRVDFRFDFDGDNLKVTVFKS